MHLGAAQQLAARVSHRTDLTSREGNETVRDLINLHVLGHLPGYRIRLEGQLDVAEKAASSARCRELGIDTNVQWARGEAVS